MATIIPEQEIRERGESQSPEDLQMKIIPSELERNKEF
jgi:hypothetical protein